MKNVVLLIAMLFCMHTIQAQVVVTSAGNVDMCVGGAYKTIPDFKVAEKVNTDFNTSTSLQTYELNAPNNFEFNPGVGLVTVPSSTDIAFAYLTVTATKITLNYFLNTTAQKDSFIFKNIQVRAVGTNSSNDLRFTGGTASQNQNNLNQYAHAHFNSAGTNVSLNLSNNSVCINAGNVTLNGASPGGGTFTGTGVTGNTFNPTVAGVGTFVISYAQTTNGCTGTATANITVKPVPSVTFFGLGNSYCSGDDAVALTGFPSGGTFSGSGISGTNFLPQAVSNPPATVSVTYTYTDPSTNCSASSTKSNISIKASPTNTSISLNPERATFSSTEDSVLISGNPTNPPSGGQIIVTGNGVATVNGVSRFYPKVIGQGSSEIIRTIVSNGCSTSVSRTVSVSASVSNTINGLGSSYCKSSGTISLNVVNGVGKYQCKTIVNGVLIDVTSTMINDVYHDNGLGAFVPSGADNLDAYYYIYFIDSLDINRNGFASTYIKSSPVVKILSALDSSKTNVLSKSYCTNDAVVTLSATPTGGVFSGPGVTNNKFNPSQVSAGNQKIIYTINETNGCKGADTVVVNIRQAQSLSIIGPALSGAQEFCGNDTIMRQCSGIPAGGYFKGVGIIDTLGGKFKASNAVESNDQDKKIYPITYFYTSSNKCISSIQQLVTVNKAPVVSFSGMNNTPDKTKTAKYCNSDNEVQLIPTLSPGNFTLINSTGDTIPNGLNNSKLSPKLRTADSYRVIYSYTDSQTKCTASETQNVIIYKLPEVSLDGLKSKYCERDPAAALTLNPSINSSSGTGILSSTTSAAISGSSFLPASSAVKKHKLTYTFTNEFGCVNWDSDSTIVYGNPVINFSISTRCVGDTIVLKDSNSDVTSSAEASSYIDYNLNKWDIDSKTTIKDTIHRVFAQGNHSFKYTVTTNQGCSTTKDSSIFIGPYPVVAFSWDNVCNADDTKFKNGTAIPITSDSWIDTLRWDLGDGAKLDLKALNQAPETSYWDVHHTYPTYGIYNVTQTAITNLNCKTIDSQKVYILPSVVVSASDPYSNDFEMSEGGWVSSGIYDDASTWKWGVAEQTVINTKSSDDHVWVTGLKNPNSINEISYVYSPCFNLAALTKPMIRMNIWRGMDTIPNLSGAVLQYSADGMIWRKVGDKSGEGINWYNNTVNINSRPNGSLELNQDGWTGMDSLGWENVRHVLDTVIVAAGTNNLRFRIAFAASNTPYNGFAFDDVWIGERTKLMLVEHFTSNASIPAIAENNYINGKTNVFSKDMVQLQYHTGFAGPDQMFSRNVSDPGARALYYGISQVPASTLDGSYYNGNTRGVDDRRIKSRVLEDPQFSVNIVPDVFDPASQNVSGNIVIESKVPVSNNVTVQIAVLERFVSNVTGQNGESTYQWVNAKLLPDAAGKSFGANWTVGHTETIPFTWNFNSSTIYNPDKLAIIAFVQDNVTKEIYQAAYKGLGATVTTGVFDPNEETSTVMLYPNPANDLLHVILSGTLSSDYAWSVVDGLGRVVDQGIASNQTDGFVINTQKYASGFYTLRLSNAADGVKTQKFVVVH